MFLVKFNFCGKGVELLFFYGILLFFGVWLNISGVVYINFIVFVLIVRGLYVGMSYC